MLVQRLAYIGKSKEKGEGEGAKELTHACHVASLALAPIKSSVMSIDASALLSLTNVPNTGASIHPTRLNAQIGQRYTNSILLMAQLSSVGFLRVAWE